MKVAEVILKAQRGELLTDEEATLLEKLAIKLEPDVLRRVWYVFMAYPECDAVYVFSDGRVEPEESFQKRMTSRTAGLVSIATEGIPVLISRKHAVLWDYRKGRMRTLEELPSPPVRNDLS